MWSCRTEVLHTVLQRLIDSESRQQQPGRPSHHLLQQLRLAKQSDSLVLWLRAVAAHHMSQVADLDLQAMVRAEYQGTGRRRSAPLRSRQATLAALTCLLFARHLCAHAQHHPFEACQGSCHGRTSMAADNCFLQDLELHSGLAGRDPALLPWPQCRRKGGEVWGPDSCSSLGYTAGLDSQRVRPRAAARGCGRAAQLGKPDHQAAAPVQRPALLCRLAIAMLTGSNGASA